MVVTLRATQMIQLLNRLIVVYPQKNDIKILKKDQY